VSASPRRADRTPPCAPAVVVGHRVLGAVKPRGQRFAALGPELERREFPLIANPTAKEIAVLCGHDDDMTSAGFSPDGSRIVTASFDKTARIWDAPPPDDVGENSCSQKLLRDCPAWRS
jgi:hypothetical protein